MVFTSQIAWSDSFTSSKIDFSDCVKWLLKMVLSKIYFCCYIRFSEPKHLTANRKKIFFFLKYLFDQFEKPFAGQIWEVILRFDQNLWTQIAQYPKSLVNWKKWSHPVCSSCEKEQAKTRILLLYYYYYMLHNIIYYILIILLLLYIIIMCNTVVLLRKTFQTAFFVFSSASYKNWLLCLLLLPFSFSVSYS